MKELDIFEQTIGPTPSEQERRQRASLERGIEQLRGNIKQSNEKRQKFEGKYGPDLTDYGIAYSERVRPDNYGRVFIRNEWVEVKEARTLFANTLSEQLSLQPEETRTEWLTGYLEELDQMVPPIKNRY